MTTEQVFTVIDKLVAMGVKKVMITGGEPSSRSDFVEIASYAASKFLAISIATNGYCITQSIVDQLAKHRNIAVQISLDGTETSHNYIRGVQDSFTKAVSAIKRFSSAGIPVIVASTFNAYNCNDIEAVTRIAKESKTDYLFCDKSYRQSEGRFRSV